MIVIDYISYVLAIKKTLQKEQTSEIKLVKNTGRFSRRESKGVPNVESTLSDH